MTNITIATEQTPATPALEQAPTTELNLDAALGQDAKPTFVETGAATTGYIEVDLPASASQGIDAQSEVSLDDADAILKATEERRQRVQDNYEADRKAKKGPANPILAKYPGLSAVFLKADSAGQITSLFREFNKGEDTWSEKFRSKLADFRQGLKEGDISITDDITMREVKKLQQMGIEIEFTDEVLEKIKMNTPSRKDTGTGTRAPTSNPLLQKYPHLSASFLRGAFKGQLDSVYKSREVNPEKVKNFVDACKAGELALPETYSKAQAEKLKTLGLVLPENMITG